jgi:hypothetical protein
MVDFNDQHQVDEAMFEIRMIKDGKFVEAR